MRKILFQLFDYILYCLDKTYSFRITYVISFYRCTLIASVYTWLFMLFWYYKYLIRIFSSWFFEFNKRFSDMNDYPNQAVSLISVAENQRKTIILDLYIIQISRGCKYVQINIYKYNKYLPRFYGNGQTNSAIIFTIWWLTNDDWWC